jgi:superfamily II DNA or RNA helicase
MSLRPRQIQAIDDLRQAYGTGKRTPILRAPTGFGKTHTTAEIIKNAVSRGKRVWFTAHLRELLLDTSKRLTSSGIPHSFICAGYPMGLKQAVQVVSAETLMRRLGKIPRDLWPDLLIVDEAHVGMDRTKKLQDALGNPLSLLLTATPSRLDGRGLGEISDTIIETCGTQELIDEGLLVPIRYFAPSAVNLTGIKQRAGDYAQDELAAAMDKPAITGSAVSHYRKLAHRRPAVAFCVSLDHAEHTAAEFRASGYRAMVVRGDSTELERSTALKALANGTVDVVCNCQLWIAGVDCPAISCIILLAPTQSLTRYLQSVGRGLRTHPDKKDCVILDHANCAATHGLPTEDREWSLDGARGKKSKRDPDDIPIKTCPDCFRVLRSTVSVCECGHVFTPKGREIEVKDGELAEIDLLAVRRERMREQGSAQTLDDLRALAKAKGYKPGWADRIWQARQSKQSQKYFA